MANHLSFVHDMEEGFLFSKTFALKEFDEPKDNKVEKELSTRERETLLKIIIGMAIDGYGYKRGKSSNIPTSVSEKLKELETPVSDETIRNKLKEAQDLIISDYW